MTCLVLTEAQKADILARLETLPRPKHLAGKVCVSIEFNCRPDGSVGDVYVETSCREFLRRAS